MFMSVARSPLVQTIAGSATSSSVASCHESASTAGQGRRTLEGFIKLTFIITRQPCKVNPHCGPWQCHECDGKTGKSSLRTYVAG